MAYYRVTFYYTSAGYGLSETWITKDVSEANLAIRMVNLNALRLGMLPPSYVLAGVRASALGSGVFVTTGKRQSRLFLPGANAFPGPGDTMTLKEVGTYALETATGGLEQLRSNLQIRLTFAGGRTTTRYVCGISDLLSETSSGSLDFTRAPKWYDAFKTWRDEVVTYWNIAGRSLIADDPSFNVRGIVKRATGRSVIGMVVTTPDPQAWVVGDLISVSGFRRTKTSVRISVNGKYHLDQIAPDLPSSGLTTFYLRELIGVEPEDIKVFGTIRRVRRTTFTLTSMDTVRLGIHKRGRPSLTPRGRRLTHATLDP